MFPTSTDHRKSFASALTASRGTGIFRKSLEAVYDKRSAETSLRTENLFSRTRTFLSKAVINRSKFLFIACCLSDLEDEINNNKFARNSFECSLHSPTPVNRQPLKADRRQHSRRPSRGINENRFSPYFHLISPFAISFGINKACFRLSFRHRSQPD